MKTPSQWRETYPDLFEHTIKLIQEDAFESGRVAGRKYELDRVASILRDSGKPEMVAMAFSCERLSAGISTPPTKTTEK